jgi:hypothetical protein
MKSDCAARAGLRLPAHDTSRTGSQSFGRTSLSIAAGTTKISSLGGLGGVWEGKRKSKKHAKEF